MYIKHYIEKNSSISSCTYIFNKQCSSHQEIQSYRTVLLNKNTV